MLARLRVIMNKSGTLIAKWVVLAAFLTEFILCIVILSENSSSPSLAMTIPRMFAALTTALLVALIIKKLPIKTDTQNLAVKVLACVAMLLRIMTVIFLQYHSRNPTEECFVSSQASSTLTYMDIVSFAAIAVLTWQYLREDKLQKMMLIETN